MSVAQVYEMSYDELLGWRDYFARRPVGWQEDDRAAKLLQAQGVKEKATAIFPSLKVIYHGGERVNQEGTDMGSLTNSPLFGFMSQSVGGDKLS